ncbi:MAG: NACHT domain-containing protein, partial [Rivularia sp. (in: cyanobacteria)]
MIEWLTAWGVSNAVGFLFKPVMQKFAEDLGKDILKDVLKDVVKGLPGNILGRLEKDEINKAVGKAFKEFLEIFQQELINDLEETEVKQYNQSLKKFLGIDDVKAILGSAFHPEIDKIDTKKLEQIWYDKNLLQLPEEFDWRRLNKPYYRKVKAIIHESDKLREIFDSYKLEEIADNTKQIAGISPDFHLPRYQEALRQKYGYLKLDSLDTSGSAYNELKLRSTFIIQNIREFERVLPQALEKTKEYQKWLRDNQEEAEFNLKELERDRQLYSEAPTIPVTDIVNNHQSRDYTIILGDPGAGKSTLLQFLALNWAESTLSNSFTQQIPILIELRTYVRQFDKDKCKNFLDFLHQAPGAICHLNQLKLNELFKAGNALVMFDGLDEIFDKAKREDIITDIIRFTDKYPNVQVIVTSRVIGYKPERFRNAEFRHFMLQDFDSEQTQEFINRWHQLAFNDKNDAVLKKARLNRALKSSKAIQELAGNPLLLTMMAILSRHRELPRDRSTLYEKAAEVLLQQWDAERYLEGKVSIDLTDKQAILHKVAYQMQANDRGLTGNLIHYDDLQQIFQAYLQNIGYQKLDARTAAKELINQLRDRNFILCHAGDNYYAFVHRTFLEYFCAEAFRRQFEKEQKLTLEQLKTEVYGKHWQDEAWDEVLKLIAGAIDVKFVGEIIEYLIGIDGEEEKFRNVFLAAGCLGEVRERKSGDIYALDRRLLGIVKDLVGYGFYRQHVFFSSDYVANDNANIREIRTLSVATIATTWNNGFDTIT